MVFLIAMKNNIAIVNRIYENIYSVEYPVEKPRYSSELAHERYQSGAAIICPKGLTATTQPYRASKVSSFSPGDN